ncbi:hypothetical protein KM043_003124 [Ampulex compressa]|nr:hypothetical protein KM043_003124 [Ampulex compressa]
MRKQWGRLGDGWACGTETRWPCLARAHVGRGRSRSEASGNAGGYSLTTGRKLSATSRAKLARFAAQLLPERRVLADLWMQRIAENRREARARASKGTRAIRHDRGARGVEGGSAPLSGSLPGMDAVRNRQDRRNGRASSSREASSRGASLSRSTVRRDVPDPNGR